MEVWDSFCKGAALRHTKGFALQPLLPRWMDGASCNAPLLRAAGMLEPRVWHLPGEAESCQRWMKLCVLFSVITALCNRLHSTKEGNHLSIYDFSPGAGLWLLCCVWERSALTLPEWTILQCSHWAKAPVPGASGSTRLPLCRWGGRGNPVIDVKLY